MKTASAKLVLLDTNVLLALAWPNHQFYAAATNFMEAFRGKWATCAITEIGFIHLSTNALVVGLQKSPQEASNVLAQMTADPHHRFVGTMPSPVGPEWKGIWGRIQGTKQVTDAYLLALAIENRARLVTFDGRLSILGTPKDIEVLTSKSQFGD